MSPLEDDLPDSYIIVGGGSRELPPPGEIISGSFGETLEEAAPGVPHGMIRVTTAGEIRRHGGTVVVKPEPTRSGGINFRHVDIMEGSGVSTFSEPFPNPVPKELRIR